MQKIAIVSLGLIGGSILKALSGKDYDLYAVTRNPKAIEAARAYTKNVSSDLTTIKDCEVVFVCSPMSNTIEMLDKLESVVKPDTIVADVCSLKAFVMQKKRPYCFIGTHPMAGTEHSGFEASFAQLFDGAKWVITPSETSCDEKVKTLVEIIEKTGAQTIFAGAQEHDRAAALISHMPMLIAQALVKTAMPDSLATKLASSGFRDTTRLAMTECDLVFSMYKNNEKNILIAFKNLENELNNLKNLSDDEKIKLFKAVAEKRAKMYDNNGKNIL